MLIPMTMMTADENDGDFVSRLFLENEMAMFRAAHKVVKNRHIARDMVSESCVTMIKKVKFLREVEVCKQTAYIISIVKNNSCMYLRKQKREVELLKESQHLWRAEESEEQEADSRLIAEAEVQMVHEALSKIRPKDRDLIQMKYFEGLSDGEIAQRMEIGVDSVRFYLTKARRKLAEELKKGEEE